MAPPAETCPPDCRKHGFLSRRSLAGTFNPGRAFLHALPIVLSLAGAAPAAAQDDDLPEVVILADQSVTEGAIIRFWVEASPRPTENITVEVTVRQEGNVAASGQTGKKRLTIGPRGHNTLTVATEDDARNEPDGAITATVDPGEGYTPSRVDEYRSVSVQVKDNDIPAVSIQPGPAIGEGAAATFKLTARPRPANPIGVSLTVSESGQFSAAGQTGARTAVIGANGEGTLTVQTESDATDEDDGTITATVTAAATESRYTVGSPASAQVGVSDGGAPTPRISLSAASEISEGETVTFTLTASPAPAASLDASVNLAEQGSFAAEGEIGARTVTIGAGGTGTLTVATKNDLIAEPDGSITATLADGDGYLVGSPGEVSVTVRDRTPRVSIAAGPAIVEGGTATFTLTANPRLSQSFDVEVDVGESGSFADTGETGSRTVAIGTAGTGTLEVATFDDTVLEADGTITATVIAGSGYGIGSPSRASVNVADATPRISIAAGDAIIEGSSATFTLTADPKPSGTLYVDVDVSESGSFAVGGEAGRRTVAIGQDGAGTLTIATDDDDEDEPTGTITATIDAGQEPAYYGVGSPNSAAVQVNDDDIGPERTLSVSVADAEVRENALTNGSRVPLKFTVSLSEPPRRRVQVSFSVRTTAESDTTAPATLGQDYEVEERRLRVSFPIDITEVVVQVWVLDDDLFEEKPETIELAITEITGAEIADGRAIGTILPDPFDAPRGTPVVTIEGGSAVTEGDDAVFTLKAEPAPKEDLIVTLTVHDDGTSDFLDTASEGTRTLTIYGLSDRAYVYFDGVSEQTLRIDTVDDAEREADGAIRVVVESDPDPDAGGDYVANTPPYEAAVAVQDNERGTPVITIEGGPVVTEGEAAVFTLKADPATEDDLTVTVEVHDDSGGFIDDKDLGVRTVTIAGVSDSAFAFRRHTTATLAVDTVDDSEFESRGNVRVTIQTDPDGRYRADTQPWEAVVEVRDDETPTVSVTPPFGPGERAVEGDRLAFTLGVDPVAASELQVSVTVAQPNNDYVDIDPDTGTGTRTLTIPANSAAATVIVDTVDDDIEEGADGTVTVTLESLGNDDYQVAAAPGNAAAATVADNDGPPVVSISGGSAVTEGGTARFTLTASPAPAATIAVNIDVHDFGDFASSGQAGSRSVRVGASGTAAMTVTTDDDSEAETDGAITATVRSGAGYSPSSVSGSAVIAVSDNDAPPPPPGATPVVTISGGDAVTEGGEAVFLLGADPAPSSDLAVEVNIAESGDFAASGELGARTVTIAGGEAMASLAVATVDDEVDEADGYVRAVVNSGAGYAVGGVGQHTLTIADNDEPPPPDVPIASFSSSSSSAGEDEGAVTVAVVLDTAPAREIVLRYSVGGTAAAGSDFGLANSGSATVAAGSRLAAIAVAIEDDSADESDETVILTLTAGAGYAVGGVGQHTLTIADNDEPPPPDVPIASFSSSSSSAGEDEGAVTVAVVLDTAPAREIVLRYSVGGTAAAGSDFGLANSGSATVAAGSRLAAIAVAIEDDSADESDETVILTLTAGAGYAVGGVGQHTLTIADNDEPPPSNRAPAGADGAVHLDEDADYFFRAADFGFTDPDADGALAGVRIVTLPDDGTLSVDGAEAAAGQLVDVADIDSGKFSFSSAANDHASPYAGFRFRVGDGEDESETDNTMTIHIRSVNDPATGQPEIVGAPRPGEMLLAQTAGVADPDGLTGAVFSYQWLRTGDSGEKDIPGANANDYTLTQADLDSTLIVRVRFVDDDGFAEEVDSEPTQTIQPGMPGAPMEFSATAEDGQAILRWRAPEDDGGASIADYEYRYAPGHAVPTDTAWVSAGTSPAVTIAGLANGETYALEVRAANRAGAGPAATASIFLPIPATAPDAPQELTAAAGEREVLLSWTAPEDDGGEPVHEFEYRFTEGTMPSTATPWRSAGAGPRVLVTGLGYYRDYHFEVRAINAVGPGPAASASARTLPRKFSDVTVEGWLARFGRAASGDMAEAIRQRLDEGSQRQQLIIGGRNLAGLFPRPRESTGGPLAPMRPPETAQAIVDWLHDAPGADAAANYASPIAGAARGTIAAAGPSSAFGSVNGYGAGAASVHTLPKLGDLLLNSSFFHTFTQDNEGSSSGAGNGRSNGTGGMGATRAGARTIWASAGGSRFNANVDALQLDGEVDTGTVGFDAQWGQWLAGVSISHSDGEGRFEDGNDDAGTVDSTLTGVYPYAHYRFNRRTSFWGVAGRGTGELQLLPDKRAPATVTDIRNTMAAFGGRGVFSIHDLGRGTFELALRSDTLFTNTASDAGMMLEEADASTRRLRLLLEATGSIATGGGLLSPTLEAGFRHDGGDAEQGTGFEFGSGLAWSTGPVTVQVNGRVLLAHEDDAYREWGYSAGVQYRPDADGRGLLLNLSSSRGAAFGGAQQLWDLPDAGGLTSRPGRMQDRSTGFELGYGLKDHWREALWYPYLGVEDYAGNGRALKFGLKLDTGTSLNAGLEFGRRENGFESPLDAIRLRGLIRF